MSTDQIFDARWPWQEMLMYNTMEMCTDKHMWTLVTLFKPVTDTGTQQGHSIYLES